MMEIRIIIEAPELASAINNLAVALSKKSRAEPVNETLQLSSEPNPPTQTTTVPSIPVESTPKYTIEQIMKAGAALMDAGKIDELRKLIDSFGVEAVTNLKPEQLGAFATELRKLGAKI